MKCSEKSTLAGELVNCIQNVINTAVKSTPPAGVTCDTTVINDKTRFTYASSNRGLRFEGGSEMQPELLVPPRWIWLLANASTIA